MEKLKKCDPKVYKAILNEIVRQQENIELIASENYATQVVMEAQGSIMTNKYAEGYPGARWYGGCKYMDEVERLAVERAKKIFGAEHVNVQSHSGSQANMAVFFAVLEIGDKVLAMDLSAGGHLTHGHKLNYSGKYFQVIGYGVNRETEMIDYDEVERLAIEHKPKLILCGASAYSRIIDFKRFREIADKVGAILMADIAHIAGLIAAGLHPSAVPYADFVTSTTHKTLRGPRGGFIMCKSAHAKKIDSIVFPGVQGGPLMHVIAAKAVAFHEVLKPSFKAYQKQIIKNSQFLCEALKKKGYRIVSGGTDNHLFMVDLRNKNILGKDASAILDRAKITVNKNTIPFDDKFPGIASGIRIGTPAVTTRGMKEKEMKQIADFIDKILTCGGYDKIIKQVREDVIKLTKKFPIYTDILKKMKKDC